MGDRDDEIEQLRAKVLELECTLGTEHAETSDAKAKLSNLLYSRGRYWESELLFREVIEVRGRVLGSEHPNTLAIKFNLALCLFRQSEYNKAERIFHEIIEAWERIGGVEHPETLTTMNSLAVCLLQHGQYAASERIFRKVLEIRAQVRGMEHQETLTTKNDLAVCLLYQGQYQKSEQLFREVLEIERITLDQLHPDSLATNYNLAACLLPQGRYSEAELLFRDMLEISERIRNPSHPEILTMKGHLALCLLYQGQYQKSEQLFREILEIQERVCGMEHVETLATKSAFALSLLCLGQYAVTEQIFRAVIEAFERILGLENPYTLQAKHSLSFCLCYLGQYQEAEQILHQVLEIQERVIGSENPNTLTIKNSLALSLLYQGQYSAAERLFYKVIEMRARVLGPEHPETLSTKSNRASCLVYLREFQAAEQIIHEVIEISARVLGPTHPETLTTKHNLASLLYDLGRYSEAEQIFFEVLEFRKRSLSSEHPNTETSRCYYTKTLLVNDHHKIAVEQIRASTYVPWKLDSILSGESPIQRMESLLPDFLRVWHKSEVSPALDVLDKLVSLRITRDLVASLVYVDPPENEDLKAALAAQRTMINLVRPANYLNQMTGGVTSRMDSVEITRRMKELSIEVTTAAEKLRVSEPSLAGVFFPKWLDENEVREVLRPGEVALYLCSDEKEGFGVLVSADEVRLEPLLFPNGRSLTTEQLEERVAAIRDEVAIEKRDSPQYCNEFYRAIFFPFQDSIRGKNLIIVPTGPFRVVPYSLLRDKTGYLSELCHWSLAPSLSALGIIRKAEEFENPYRDRLLAVAYPVYTLDEAQKLGLDTERSRCVPPTRTTFRKNTEGDEIPLPGTKLEVDQIKTFFPPPPDTVVLEQVAATKRRLLGTPWEKYGHFHFACHARAVDDGQDESALVLSRYDEEQSKLGESDSFVTYTDILSRKIPNAVVVLSACNTARGKRMGADLFSLARAFQGAGARAVLATLWRIPDEETPEFVEALYRRYRSEEKSLREALLETQEDFRRRGQPPHVWAPWVLVGE